VNLHLKSVPGLGTLTTRSFAGSNFQDLSGKPNRALDSQLLVLGTINEIVAEFLQVADVGRRQGNPDFVDFFGRRVHRSHRTLFLPSRRKTLLFSAVTKVAGYA